MVFLSWGVGGGVTHNLEGEQHLTPTFSHPNSIQLCVMGAQEEKGVEPGIKACGGHPEVHAAAPQDQGQQGTAEGAPERGPRRGHLPSKREGESVDLRRALDEREQGGCR